MVKRKQTETLSTDGPPTYNGSTQYNFSTLQSCQSDKPSVGTVPRILNFDLPPAQRCAVQSSHDAPSQPHHHEGKQSVQFQPFYIQTTILLFTFNTVFNKLHEIVNTSS